MRFLLLLAILLPCAGFAAEVKAVRIWAAPGYTRAVLDVSEAVEYKLFTLENPSRLVLDVKGASARSLGAEPRGLVSGIRSGQYEGKQLRVVFDLSESVRPKSFLLPPADRFRHRLVLDLYPARQTAPVVRYSEPANASAGRKVIVAIDAGHGGDDPGAIGAKGTFEKEITLKVALALAERVNKEPGMAAFLTRNSDYFLPLGERYELARKNKADLFLSIHADAFSSAAPSGSSVFILSQRGASNEAARYLADRENRSDLVGGVSLGDKDATLAAVLLDLSQGATLEASSAAAENVLASLSKFGKTHKRYVERANFQVLRSPDVPSVLVETAFISNPNEERNLNDPGHRARLSDAIMDGVRNYFHSSPPPGTWLAANAAARSHIVNRGETLTEIAVKHRVTVSSLRAVNQLSTDSVKAGSVLRIPTDT